MHALYPGRRVLWMPFDFDWQMPSAGTQHCCNKMDAALDYACDNHADPFECGDYALVYHPLFHEYGLVIRDGGMSYLLIDFCPFCAVKLPERRRDWWFDEVERLGLEDIDFADLPDTLRN